ncbi:transcription factor Adf-1-like [Schistocerca americana]|uniref:transcription factor Adf-1-like n=1 Tax=Schistocerca americana TaxID=7009 RepID=UPI001F5015D3|nr:transcription factor Adf-1-like [Schistocerca americana]
MTSWFKQNTLHFIEAVRRHPCIWDVKIRDYKNTHKRYDEWEEIAKAFNVSRKECEDKWHNLKSQYSRELAKRKSSKGSGSATSKVYHTSWYAFESMQFVRDNYKPLSHRSTHEVVPVSKFVILFY